MTVTYTSKLGALTARAVVAEDIGNMKPGAWVGRGRKELRAIARLGSCVVRPVRVAEA